MTANKHTCAHVGRKKCEVLAVPYHGCGYLLAELIDHCIFVQILDIFAPYLISPESS